MRAKITMGKSNTRIVRIYNKDRLVFKTITYYDYIDTNTKALKQAIYELSDGLGVPTSGVVEELKRLCNKARIEYENKY